MLTGSLQHITNIFITFETFRKKEKYIYLYVPSFYLHHVWKILQHLHWNFNTLSRNSLNITPLSEPFLNTRTHIHQHHKRLHDTTAASISFSSLKNFEHPRFSVLTRTFSRIHKWKNSFRRVSCGVSIRSA